MTTRHTTHGFDASGYPIFRHAAAGSGGGSTSEEEVNVEALQSRIQELEEELDVERKQFRVEMRKGQDAVDKMRKAAPAIEKTAASPTHTWDDGYDVITRQRVAVFVDVQNMYYAARNLYNSKLEFSKLLKFLGRGRQLCRALAYIVERPGMEQDKFIEVLRRNGYEVQKKVLIERADGSQKGDWDLGIALDAVSLADRVDAAVLVTGDGDFTTLCTYLRNRGVRVEVASFPESTAVELMKSCDHFHRLDERILLPGAQFQNPADVERGDVRGGESRSSEVRTSESRGSEIRSSEGRGGAVRSGESRIEVRSDRDSEDDADDTRERGRRKRARGPLDDDLSEDEFDL